MFGNGRHLTQEEVSKLGIMEKGAVNRIIAHANNFIQQIPNVPTEEKAFMYDMYHPAFKENARYKGFIGTGTTHYQKYGDLLVEFNEISIPEKNKTAKTIHGYFNFKVEDMVLSQKVEIVKNGDLVVNNTSEAESDNYYIPSNEFPNDPSYTPGEISDGGGLITPQWGALCVNACCRFRLNGNPFNPLVTYRHCGQNCGTQGDYGGNTPINPLDRCCASHDAC
jgi:hypothetical protein